MARTLGPTFPYYDCWAARLGRCALRLQDRFAGLRNRQHHTRSVIINIATSTRLGAGCPTSSIRVTARRPNQDRHSEFNSPRLTQLEFGARKKVAMHAKKPLVGGAALRRSMKIRKSGGEPPSRD